MSRRRARAPASRRPPRAGERRRVGDDLGHPPGLRGQRRRSGEHVPPPVARDPDRDDLDVVPVERVDHRSGGQAADLVLGGPAAEQHHHTASCHRGEPIGWPSRRDRRRGATRPRRSGPHQLVGERTDPVYRRSRPRARSGRSAPDADPHRPARPQRPWPGLRHTGADPQLTIGRSALRREREPHGARLALHRQPVRPARDGPLRCIGTAWFARSAASALRRLDRPCRAPPGSAACPASPSRSRTRGTDRPSRGTAAAGPHARRRTRSRAGRGRTRGCTRSAPDRARGCARGPRTARRTTARPAGSRRPTRPGTRAQAGRPPPRLGASGRAPVRVPHASTRLGHACARSSCP